MRKLFVFIVCTAIAAAGVGAEKTPTDDPDQIRSATVAGLERLLETLPTVEDIRQSHDSQLLAGQISRAHAWGLAQRGNRAPGFKVPPYCCVRPLGCGGYICGYCPLPELFKPGAPGEAVARRVIEMEVRLEELLRGSAPPDSEKKDHCIDEIVAASCHPDGLKSRD